MKESFLVIIILMAFNTSFSQSDKKLQKSSSLYGGTVDCLQPDNIYRKGIYNMVDVQGTMSQISASNIIHINATVDEGTFKAAEKIIIPDLVLTCYSGSLPTSGPGTFVMKRGDGFTKNLTAFQRNNESGDNNILKNQNSANLRKQYCPASPIT